MTQEKSYLSKEKHAELKKELEYLTHERRKEIAESLEAAKALGDLSENAEYHAAREAQVAVEERIMQIEEVLKNAVIMSAKHKTDAVGIGSEVTVKKGKEEKTYTVVGSEEADISNGKISNQSPLGKAIFGKKKGDTFTYTTPQGKIDGIILDIR
jgi:transcription elongation factor GreA